MLNKYPSPSCVLSSCEECDEVEECSVVVQKRKFARVMSEGVSSASCSLLDLCSAVLLRSVLVPVA
jgi:hypothetical protein